MNLHEYQAKSLFTEFGIPVPKSVPVDSPEDARGATQNLGGDAWVVKAQIHAGARGKAGGVKLVRNVDELLSISDSLLGKGLATPQTHGRELPVNRLLIEQTLDIKRELYLGALVDRNTESVTFMASTEGGMDIEAVASNTPEKIITITANPSVGLQAFQCRQVAFALQLEGPQISALTRIMMGLYRLFTQKDLSLVEINPLVVTADNDLIALDAKMNIDDNALYRRPDLLEMRDPSQEDAKENEAAQHDLNYITLDGNIGCMVNGAGLAMATMDLIKLHGGEPANFLDVGGGTTTERVAEAFKLILSEKKVQAILVNIFGGIVRCDLIAEGIISAIKEVGVSIPVIVRLEGTNAEKGLDILAQSGLNIETASDLTAAAKKAVASV
ncbi:MAG: ADP-forming succinate--CoA ligase subunit beta [gamma proteobacterium symbiont of Taylorina sp.]|nr:ADP-forming succinate--CoA ligase subunit beta [gamma proteobacterium symbiont of Taylorina sp.]